MSNASLSGRASAWFSRALVGAFVTLVAFAAAAQDDPPGRVGRLADLQGAVSWWDDQSGQWTPAERNLPLTRGDRIATGDGARAELRVGSTALRLGSRSELEVRRLDDERMVFQRHAGSLAVVVRTREAAGELEILTQEAHLVPLRAGHYRIDRYDDTTLAGTWRGDLRVDEPDGFVVSAGQRLELYRPARSRELRQIWTVMTDDGFGEWALREDQRDERMASSRFVSPEMTGVEDLERYGRWDRHPEYGAIWQPDVGGDWAPYRDGRWAWVSPWGWTWVDAAPWGFAPFHYGRWVPWHGGWGWVPGAYVARPVFAPALVAWIGGGSWGLSLQIGGPNVGWVPLAPREPYAPHYRASPRYVERINVPPPYRWQRPPGHVPTEPVMYGNQGVPNAVTVVPRDVLERRQPVGRAVVDLRGGAARPRTPQPVTAVAPPPAPPRGPAVGVPPGQTRPALPAHAGPSREGRIEEVPRRGEPAREVIDLRRTTTPPERAPVRSPPPLPQPAPVMKVPQPAPVMKVPQPAPVMKVPPPQLPAARPPAPAAPSPRHEPAQSPRHEPAPGARHEAPTPAARPAPRPAVVPPTPVPVPAPVAAPARPAPPPVAAKPPPGERDREDERKRIPEARERARENQR
jgi:hypothetical protein